MGLYVPGGTAVLPSTALMLSVVSLIDFSSYLIIILRHPATSIVLLIYIIPDFADLFS